MGPLPWSPFWLNPRRLGGSDFLMRWSQGVWSEERFIGAVNGTGRYVARPCGPSRLAPSEDVRQHELYFERLAAAAVHDVGLDESHRSGRLRHSECRIRSGWDAGRRGAGPAGREC